MNRVKLLFTALCALSAAVMSITCTSDDDPIDPKYQGTYEAPLMYVGSDFITYVVCDSDSRYYTRSGCKINNVSTGGGGIITFSDEERGTVVDWDFIYEDGNKIGIVYKMNLNGRSNGKFGFEENCLSWSVAGIGQLSLPLLSGLVPFGIYPNVLDLDVSIVGTMAFSTIGGYRCMENLIEDIIGF